MAEEVDQETTVGVRMPGRLLKRLDAVLKGEYPNRSEYVRELIRRDLANREARGMEAEGGAA